jgi:hypothetical protein
VLVIELCLVFLAVPLAAEGFPIARPVAQILLLAVVAIVVMLSHRGGAIFLMILGLAVTLGSLSPWPGLSPLATGVLNRGGEILTFSALTWVVAFAVYAPGRITSRRLQGAVVLYLNLAVIFASAFSIIWILNPAAFSNLPAATGSPDELATMLYFSLTTLTTTGYGDIAPVDPFARSLANLESVLGLFYLAITVARLVTLELDDWRR